MNKSNNMKNITLTSLAFLFLYSCSSSISPVDDALEKQIFHYGNGSEPQGLDPHVVTGVPEHNILIGLGEGLTSSNPRGGENLPGAAESWEISEDGRVYTLIFKKMVSGLMEIL